MTNVNPFLANLARKSVETIEKNEKIFLKRLSHKSPARSSGSVLLDFILNGGLQSRFLTLAGLPHSGKSLSSNSIISDACRDGIPVFYFDAEGNISTSDLEEVFGGELDNLIENGIFNFYQDKTARVIEKVISSIEDTLQIFPSKEYVEKFKDEKGKVIEDKEGWYYTFIHDARTEEGKRDQAQLKTLLEDKSYKIDRELSAHDLYGRGVRDYVKIPDSKDKSGMQVIFVIDSLAALIPEKLKDDQDGGGLLLEPRLLSTYLKRICPDLERKCAMLVGTNQGYLEMPTGPYSAPKYIEKGGVGLKHYRGIGFVLTERAASTAGGEKEEMNPLKDRVDLYTYTEFKCVRNRINTATENKKYYRRSWKTSTGELMGWDPFWDAVQYLKLTEQYEIGRGKIKINIKVPSSMEDNEEVIKYIDAINDITWDYDSFKTLILSNFVDRDDYKSLKDDLYKEMKLEERKLTLNDFKNISIKDILYQQIKDRDVFDNKSLVLKETNYDSIDDDEVSSNDKVESL